MSGSLLRTDIRPIELSPAVGCAFDEDCSFCLSELARALPPNAIATARAAAGSDVFGPDDGWHAVVRVYRGIGALYRRLPNGERRIVDFVLPGETVAISGAPTAVGLRALDDLVYCSLPERHLAVLIERRPELALKLGRATAAWRDLASDRFAHLAQQAASARVARLLLELALRSLRRWPIAPGAEVALPIPQRHLAEATGLSTSYVSRTLAAFSRAGILNYRWGRLIVLEPDTVTVAAGVRPETAAHWTERRVPSLPPPLCRAYGEGSA